MSRDPSHSFSFRCSSTLGQSQITFEPQRLIIAGWTARDPAALEAHIAELEELGVARPESTPVFYRASTSRLTMAPRIQVIGDASSGEAECVLLNIEGSWYVGVGSDHTDRAVESYDVAVSKQICDKPIATEVWPLEEVQDHWDSLMLRSYASTSSRRELYQEGPVSALLNAADLLERFAAQDPRGSLPGDVVFGGTLSVIGGVRPAESFEIELEDPVVGRRIGHGYEIQMLGSG